MFPPSFEHAFHASRGCVCLLRLPARPRSQARHRPGLSVRGGPMRVDGATNPELIHQWRAGPDPAADADRTPLRLAGVTNPAVAEMRKRDGSPVSFLRKTESACARARGPAKPLGRRSDVRGRGLRLNTQPRIGKATESAWPVAPRDSTFSQHRLAARTAGQSSEFNSCLTSLLDPDFVALPVAGHRRRAVRVA